jgi:Na+/proline symporter
MEFAMNYFSIDYLIVYAFLAITLFIGIRAGRGIKDIREYALAGKNYGTLTLLLTFLTTNIGSGSVMQAASGVFSEGIIDTVAVLGVSISLLFVALFIAPKIVQFGNCLTIGDVMGISYGKLSQLLAGVLGVLYASAMVSMQLLGLGIIFKSFLQVDASLGIIIGGLILTIYSAYGGIKSVTVTDVFQFIILIIVFPLIANIMLKHAGGLKHVFMQLPPAKVEIFSHKNFSYYLTLFLVWSILPVGITSPPLFQRMLMARNGNQLQTQYFIAAGFDPIFRLLIMLIGLSGLILYPTIEGKNLLSHIIQDFLPVGAKGIAIAGLLAVVISTADSYLNSAGIVVAHDILKPIYDKYGWKINELKWAKYSTLCIGIAGIIIALKSTSMLGLSFLAVKFTGPLLMFPLLAEILGLKSDKKTFYISSLVTLIIFVCISWLLPGADNHLTVPLSILANGFTFFGIHLIKHKGFYIENNIYPTIQINMLWHPRRKTLLKWLKRCLPTPARIIAYSRNKVDKYGAPYKLFGIFFAINYVAPYFMWNHEAVDTHNLMLIIRLIGCLLCITLLILQEKWLKYSFRYIPSLWHLTVLYCLPFTNTILFLTAKSSIESLTHVAIATIFLIVLLDWMSFLLISILGVVIGCLVVQYTVGSISLNFDLSSQYFLVYQLVFITLIGLLFARRKPKVAIKSTIYDRFNKTFLGEQMEFILTTTKRLANHLDMYMTNTENEWRDTHDGFFTIYTHGLQTIEDPDLFELLIDILPSIKAMRDEAKGAVQLLKESIKSNTVAANLQLESIKAFIINGACEIKFDYPSYSCTIYQIIYKKHCDPILHVVTITPSENHLLFRDYSALLTDMEKAPIFEAFSATKLKELTFNGSKPYFEAIQKRIKEIKQGYKSYSLEFPNMELVA